MLPIHEALPVLRIDYPPPHPVQEWLGRHLAWLGLRLLFPRGSGPDDPPQTFQVEPLHQPRSPRPDGRPRRVVVMRCVEEIYRGASRKKAS
jgi:hypothetical protein